MVLPCLMTVLNSIGGRCLGLAGERIQTEASLLFFYADNVEKLREKVGELSDAVHRVKHRIEEAANRGAKKVVPGVDKLLKRIASLQEEASKLFDDEERSSDSRCLMGLRPNLLACYLTSKSARNMIVEVVELLEKEKAFMDRPVANVDYSQFLGVRPIEEFEEFGSRKQVSDEIIAALKDPSVHMVGVYGMGGTGKTSLAEKIGADLQLDKTFSFVFLVTVSEKQNQLDEPNISNIQQQIAEGFKIQLQSETLRTRATEIDEQLQKKEKVLIILDDLWSKVDLRDVGIPIGSLHNKFKILLTSRDQKVLLNEMNSTKNFGLDILPHPDAWVLFDRMVGIDSKYSDWQPIAEQVVKQCGGIPIILVTIAKALRNADLKSWEYALTELKLFDRKSILEKPYKMIEVSYKFLKSEELKKLLLMCAQLNHRSIPIEDLLKYAMGLNLFKRCKTSNDISNKLHMYLSDLKGCCLLQDGNEEGIIKMHDLVHKFASDVALIEHMMFCGADGELQDWPSKDELEQFSVISLPECHLSPDQMVPIAFDNPKLEAFLMLRSEIDPSFQIPDNFFAGMKRLKVMHLARMSLSPVVVSSLRDIGELQTLCLDGCELSDIRVIGELPKLQALSLVGSSIVLVPQEIGNLGNTLKLLDLRHCQNLEKIAAGVISKLTLLEDLRIGDSFKTWQPLEGNHNRNNMVVETSEAEVAGLEEFKSLQNLINIEIHIHEHAKLFPKDLVLTKLKTYKICFGSCQERLSSKYISARTLEINESTTVEFDGEGSIALLTSAESLFLAGIMGSVTVSEMDPKGFPELRHLKVNVAEGIQYIVKRKNNTCVFPKLETLYLSELFKLERICDYSLRVGSFKKLRVIEVRKCELLNHLMSSNLATNILCLEEINVRDCESMESIIISTESGNEEATKIGFTDQLRVLELNELPLVSFYSSKQIERVPCDIPLFNKKVIFPKLEVLQLTKIKIEKIWDDRLAITAEETCWLQNLTTMEVCGCHNLSYLFTSSMVESLGKLKQLRVDDCESIEEIVATWEGQIEKRSFPKLESLVLEVLPKLKRFCHTNSLQCQSLQLLKITLCPLMKTFMGVNESSLFDEKIVFPVLKELELYKMEIENIWYFDHREIAAKEISFWFKNLTSLKVKECGNLSYLFTSSMAKGLTILKQLEVSNCESIEEIVTSTEIETVGDIQLSFPKLDSIELKALQSLNRFCHANLLECQVAFPNMKEMGIYECPSLTSIFPASLFLKTLQQLERFEVRNCYKVDLSSFKNTQQFNDAFVQHISSLKCCHLGIRGLELKYQNQRVTLQTVGRDFQLPRILFAFLKSFSELDEVAVSGYSIITQLFPCECDHLVVVAGDDMDSQANTLARIRHLNLTDLSNMKQIWSEHSPLKYHMIPEVLEVGDCDLLLSLAPPSPTLFQNLTNLVVWRCPMLTKIVTSSSTAKSLVNLKKLSVTECDSLEEIVIIDDQWRESGISEELIVFDKLEVLKLQDLISLTSFCSTTHCNFQFPSLDRMIVEYCPKMEFFSHGALSTPKLIGVVVEDEDEENEGRWEGDLNSTIQQLFEEMKRKSEKRKKLDRVVAYAHYWERLGVTPIEEFEEFESRVLLSYQIMAALRDPSVNKVGVYGMDGAGKTTLAQEIGAELQLNGTFRYVLRATVSEKQNQPDLLNIQKQIAGRFNIQLQGETLDDRATQLREQLQRRDKLLIILDDIGSKLELEKVGIPIGAAKVKILMTSESKTVLEKKMDSTNNFGLDSLPPNDARKLFDKMVGGDSQYSNWPLTAQQVIDQCQGIPVLLETIGRSLRNVQQSDWEDALTQFKQFDSEEFDEEAYKMIERNKEKRLDRSVANVGYLMYFGMRPIRDFVEFDSRIIVSNQIVAALKDPNVNKVGLYGMGGTGKTTLVVTIGAELHLDNTFDYVVLATVSDKQYQLQNNHHYDLISIQNQIAGGLKIQLQGKTLRNRAAELDKQLQKKNKVLIILDDIWLRFELKDVGIPIGTVKLKILMTSTNETVLRKEMGTTSNFRLDSLPIVEAQNLFDKVVGGDSRYSNWPQIAHQVVHQCGGIPILLVTIAKSLRYEDSETWAYALAQLKTFRGVDIVEWPHKMIEVSYNFLKFDELRNLLLLCAQLNHRSIPIEELMKYAIGLNLFKGCYTLKAVNNKLHTSLIDLKECCLLQDGNEEGTIKMHELVHKFACFVAFRDHDMFYVSNDRELEEWPSKEEFENFSAVSLRCCHLPPDHELPLAFDNPNLQSFQMLRSETDASFKIPDNFFVRMKKLKLMNLTRMSLSSVLVSSLSVLVQLRALCLDHCELSDIKMIGELPMLQALSLVGSSIVLVPKEIGKLGRTLKLLDLRRCQNLEKIAAGLICMMTSLEDLRIGDSFNSWQQLKDGDKSNNSVDETYEAGVASLEEFKSLQNLFNLEIHVRDHAKMFPKDLVFNKLETFRISFGNCEWSSIDYVSSRALRFNESAVVEIYGEGSKPLMRRAESLLLKGVTRSVAESLMSFCSFKHAEGLPSSTHLFNKKIEFPNLKELRLSTIKVEKIWDDEIAISAGRTCWLQNLTTLNVDGCSNLSYLFTSSMVQSLAQLKELAVYNCESIEEIVASTKKTKVGDSQLSFPNLESLKLNDLPKLRRFCGANLLECELLQKLTIHSCSKLKTFVAANDDSSSDYSITLFTKKVAFPNIEELEINGINCFKIICGDQFHPNSFCRLKMLTIDGVRDVSTPSMLKTLMSPRTLVVDESTKVVEFDSERTKH